VESIGPFNQNPSNNQYCDPTCPRTNTHSHQAPQAARTRAVREGEGVGDDGHLGGEHPVLAVGAREPQLAQET
jgi:hypothetical protein